MGVDTTTALKAAGIIPVNTDTLNIILVNCTLIRFKRVEVLEKQKQASLIDGSFPE